MRFQILQVELSKVMSLQNQLFQLQSFKSKKHSSFQIKVLDFVIQGFRSSIYSKEVFEAGKFIFSMLSFLSLQVQLLYIRNFEI